MFNLNLTQQHSTQIIFSDLNNLNNNVSQFHSPFIIAEKNIYTLYSDVFKNLNLSLILLLDISEHQKDITTLQNIFDFFIQHQITKQHTAIIIGGGVLHDVSIFACSVFKRGIPAVSVPTTLLSMTDAAIGGKNAINYQHYKNIIGTIYLPQKNIIIPDFLNTLPKSHLLSGWGEILKIALVYDETFYYQCINAFQNSVYPDTSIIQKAIELKTEIISKDLNDKNIRQLLNFGHSIAHAIEAICEEKKQYIPHGIAVAQGIMFEAFLSLQLNLLSEKDFENIFSFFQKHYPVPKFNEFNLSELINKILQDKKNTAQHIHFTLLEAIGKGKTKVPVNKEIIEKNIIQFNKMF